MKKGVWRRRARLGAGAENVIMTRHRFVRETHAVAVAAVFALFFAAAASRSRAEAPWEAADKIDLVPTPRELTLTGGAVPLSEDWVIVIPPDAPLAQTAAEEINDRLIALGARPLGIRNRDTAGPRIVLGSFAKPPIDAYGKTAGFSDDSPGEQGYALDVEPVEIKKKIGFTRGAWKASSPIPVYLEGEVEGDLTIALRARSAHRAVDGERTFALTAGGRIEAR